MAKLIVVTGLDQVPPTERWQRLVAPLADELVHSGLGELPELESMRREAKQRGSLEATEVAVTLARLDYGIALVDRVVATSGIKRIKPVHPARWRTYDCGEYFRSPLCEEGHWDEPAQYWYIWPATRIYEDTDRQFLVIGGPGVDGIDWGYRLGHEALWAHPIDGEYKWLASTAQALLQGYLSGAISI
jgi:hypothetical protein